MEKIFLFHGVYDILEGVPYQLNGYFHKETRDVISMSHKLRDYLAVKGVKFNGKYGVTELYFTFARSDESFSEAIALCHPYCDLHNFELGENIVFGRMKRILGDVKKIVYEMEKYEHMLYMTDVDGNQYTIGSIIRKRPKRNNAGDPIVRKVIYFQPYDINKRYPNIKHKDGTEELGALMYPYIYMRKGSGGLY